MASTSVAQTDAGSAGSTGEVGDDSEASSSTGSPSDSDGTDLPDAPEGGGQCERSGWCWVVPQPTGAHLYAVASAVPGEAWVVGGGGLVLRLHEGSWTGTHPTDVDLRAVEAVAPDDVWAAGDDGVILRFDGERWMESRPFDSALHDLWVNRDTDEVWVAGDGVLAKWVGNRWEPAIENVLSDMVWTAITGRGGQIGIVGYEKSRAYVSPNHSEPSRVNPYALWIWRNDEAGEFFREPLKADGYPADVELLGDGSWFVLVQHPEDGDSQILTRDPHFGWTSFRSGRGGRRLAESPTGGLWILGPSVLDFRPSGSETLFETTRPPQLLNDNPGFQDVVFDASDHAWVVGGSGEIVEIDGNNARHFAPVSPPGFLDAMPDPLRQSVIGVNVQDFEVTIYELDETSVVQVYQSDISESESSSAKLFEGPSAEVGFCLADTVLLRDLDGLWSSTPPLEGRCGSMVPLPSGRALASVRPPQSSRYELQLYDGSSWSPSCVNERAETPNVVQLFPRRGGVFMSGASTSPDYTWTEQGCERLEDEIPSVISVLAHHNGVTWADGGGETIVRFDDDGWVEIEAPRMRPFQLAFPHSGGAWGLCFNPNTDADELCTLNGQSWIRQPPPKMLRSNRFRPRDHFASAVSLPSGQRFLFDGHRVLVEPHP